MRPGALVVGKIAFQDTVQRSLIPDDNMIEALATNGTDEALCCVRSILKSTFSAVCEKQERRIRRVIGKGHLP
jgi:hypothetical protein